MPQARCFNAMELALTAQAMAEKKSFRAELVPLVHSSQGRTEIMPKRWTVAVIGGGIGRSHIAEGYARMPDKFDLRVLCDLDEARLTQVADEFAVPRRSISFDEVLAMDDIDVVDICTPPALHFPQAMAALAAGKEVICEKPLVGSAPPRSTRSPPRRPRPPGV